MRKPFFLFVFVFFFAFVQPAFAAMSVTALSPPQIIDTLTNQITITVSGVSTVGFYRPLFYVQGTSNYFGCALSGGTQYCGADFTQYPSLTGSGTLTLTIQADTSSSNFKGSGTYAFRIRRYTSSGSITDSDEQYPFQITQTVTPTPTPSPTLVPTPTPSLTPLPATPTPTPAPTPTVLQPVNISLSEFVACPHTGNKEWVEIFNGNNASVSLTNWKLADAGTSKQTFSTDIGAYGYVAIDIASSMYNNSDPFDTVRLLNGDGVTVDTKSYTACDPAKSWAKDESGNWSQTSLITKGMKNQFSSFATPSPSPSTTPTPTLSLQSEGAEVLGISSDSAMLGQPASTVEPTPTATMAASVTLTTKAPLWAAYGAISLGTMSILGMGGYLWYDQKIKSRL